MNRTSTSAFSLKPDHSYLDLAPGLSSFALAPRLSSFALALVISYLALALGLSSSAVAQSSPTRIRGEISQIDGSTLTVKPKSGGDPVTIKLAENYKVTGVVPAAMSDITAGKFVGAAAKPGRNGTLTAMEVLIFPESMRGTGEGFYPWDLAPQSTMTNANVAKVTAAPEGRTMLLQYKGGEKQVVVPESAPIVTLVPADHAAVKAGAHVLVSAQHQPDGSYAASRVTVGLNGLVPPM
jgi:hypothetical protein